MNGDPEAWATVAAALDPFTKPAPAHTTEGIDGTDARDPGTYDQRLADGLVELARRQLVGGDLPVRGGKRPQVVVTIGYDHLLTQLGLALLDTGIAVTAQTARRIACDAQIIPAVLGADGVPLDIGHWVDGGHTSLANGVLLCGYHHRIVHRGEWTVRINTKGRPEFIPPPYIDPDRKPRTNTVHPRT